MASNPLDALSGLFNSGDPNDQNVHVWVAILLVVMVGSLVLIKRGFGKRAI